MPQVINDPSQNLKHDENIKLFSSEVQEIISQKPVWIVRNGIVVFLMITIAIIAISFCIKYPDIVNANAELISVNAPKEIKAKTDGRLLRLLVKEGQQVQENDILGFVESRAFHNEVISLSNLVENIEFLAETKSERLPSLLKNNYKNLGELQPSYQVFMQSFNTFCQYISSGYYLRKKRMLQTDLTFLQKLHDNLNNQKVLQVEDLDLADKNFAASKSLSNDKIIADVEFRNERSKLISKAMTIPQIDASILNNENGRHEKNKEIAQLENEIDQQKVIFLQALNTLKSQINDWTNKYMFTASLSGKIAFNRILEENMLLSVGQTICFINPNNTQVYASVLIHQANFGKIKIGEKVILKFPSYPHQEYGTVTGKLEFIAAIPTDSGYNARVLLPNGLSTNYKKQLQFHEGLIARAEIITEDLKLSDRIFNGLRSVLKRD